MGWSFPRTSPARRGCANGFSDLLGLYASAANLLSVGGALVNPESEYYFDWHTQIDNPVTTLDNAVRHIARDMDAFPYGVRRSTVALLCSALYAISVKAEQ